MKHVIRMFVNGEAMSGGRLNSLLGSGRLVGESRTSARYRFYAVRDEFPGLTAAATDGMVVPGELYLVPLSVIRDELLPREPAELELSIVELEDGSPALSMALRASALTGPDVVDISTAGGWKRYRTRERP